MKSCGKRLTRNNFWTMLPNMKIEILPNGNLTMTANVRTRETIKQIRASATSEISAESLFISEVLDGYSREQGMTFEQVAPEEVGALTSAPIISDGENIYGYMDYAINNFLEELADGKTVVWQKG